MAVFCHTTSGSSAKAVCLFYDLIGIMYLHLLFFFFEQNSSSLVSKKLNCIDQWVKILDVID